MYGCVVQAVMEMFLIVWTCYMLVEFLNTKHKLKIINPLWLMLRIVGHTGPKHVNSGKQKREKIGSWSAHAGQTAS